MKFIKENDKLAFEYKSEKIYFDDFLKVIDGMKAEKKPGLLWEKEKNVINIRNRYSKMTYNLFFLEMIYLNILSIQEGE